MMSDFLKRAGRVCATVSVALAGFVGTLWAQDGEVPPTRYPADGLAILDCAPAAPAPEDSCTLRVPLKNTRTSLQSSSVDDAAVTFDFVRETSALFPEGVTQSATLLLVDLTPGPSAGRQTGFESERRLLSAFAAGLPERELVAVYGFHDELVLLQDFTTDRAAVRTALERMTLQGTNTLIGSNVLAAVELLREQENVLFKNVIVVTDGEEEGSATSVETVVDAAVDAGVAISAIGSYWRPVGAAEIGEGKAYLRQLTTTGLGTLVDAELRRGSDARAAVEAFGADLRGAASASGLIVADEKDGPADITVTLNEPVPGDAGNFRPNEIMVRFVPAGFEAQAAAEDVTEGDTLFGLPMLYIYIAVGVLAALVILGALLAMRRGAEPQAESTGDDDGEIDIDAPVPPPSGGADRAKPEKTPMPASVADAASAFLVVDGTSQRFPLPMTRIGIGRSSSNKVVLNDKSISRIHAELHPNRDGGFSITDMESLNGTFVNRERVKGTRAIKPGDTLTFGDVKTKLVAS